MHDIQEPLVQLTDIQDAVFENAAVVLALISEEGRIMNINRTALRMLEKSKGDVLNKLGGEVFNCINAWSNDEVVCGRGEHCSGCSLRNTFTETFQSGKEIYKTEGFLDINHNGEQVRLKLLISTSVVEIHERKYVLLTLDDISELKQKEVQLQEMVATKDKFFSIISHDLRGPISQIVEFINLIKSGIDRYTQDQLVEFLDMMKSSSSHSLKLLENLLMWARVQTGKITYKPIEIQLSYIVSDNVELNKNACNRKGVSIANNLDPEMTILGDYNMLDTVVRNLISNAIKFTNAGGTISINAVERKTEFLISVRDTGIGMTQDVCNQIFRIDSKYSTEGTDGEQGTGLGLVLCKDFIGQHDGEIWVESTVGEGSTFYFSIPKVATGKV